MATATAYCVRCKKKSEIKNPVQSKTKNNRNVIKGNCSACNTRVSAFTK